MNKEAQIRGPTICIIAHNAYGAMCGGRNGHVGGAEHQTTLLARWLATRGYDVSLLTWDEGQPSIVRINGVTVIKMCRADAGVCGLRFFNPRLTSLYEAMRKANADIYYHNSAEYVTGLAAAWCRRNGRKLVYSVASDVACENRLPAMQKRYERMLYRYGLRHAHKIIVQSSRQQNLLMGGFKLGSVRLPMPCPGPSEEEFNRIGRPRNSRVAWIGRAAPMKRLEWVLSVAEKLPHVTFELAVANVSNDRNGLSLQARAKDLPNVIWHGAVPRAQVPEIYRRTMCLCCTSSYEGFPNTFLEAWSHGRPVVTSFDPDGLVAKMNLGLVATDVPGFVQAIQELLLSSTIWEEKSRSARRYYVQNHKLEIAMSRLEQEIVSTTLSA